MALSPSAVWMSVNLAFFERRDGVGPMFWARALVPGVVEEGLKACIGAQIVAKPGAGWWFEPCEIVLWDRFRYGHWYSPGRPAANFERFYRWTSRARAKSEAQAWDFSHSRNH